MIYEPHQVMKCCFGILLILSSNYAMSQECNCPPQYKTADSDKATEIFIFSNKEKIEICGYTDHIKNDTFYQEAALYICGRDAVIKEWGALQPFKIRRIADTVFADDLFWLPVGYNFADTMIPFYTHKFYFENITLKEEQFFRTDQKKYTKKQIADVFEKYNKLKKGNDEHTTDVAGMLLWAYVSGSKQAELYLNSIQDKLGPFDGVVAEEWNTIYRTYQQWKNR